MTAIGAQSCGAIPWWRAPDFESLQNRYGQAEHLIVQFDFMTQAFRQPRAEFMIPNASKSGSLHPGYADVVSLATSEIWEIKPEGLEEFAAREAANYVAKALVSCGPGWKLGVTYIPTDKTGRVWYIDQGGLKAELFAQNTTPGVIVYWWKLGGKKVKLTEVTGLVRYSLRAQVIHDYFGSQVLPIPKLPPAPNDLPPIKWKSLILGDFLPELMPLRAAFIRAITSTAFARIPASTGIVVLLERDVVDAIVGARLVAQQSSMMQVKEEDPTLTLTRIVLRALSQPDVAPYVIAAARGVKTISLLAAAGLAIALSIEFLGPLAAVTPIAEESVAAKFATNLAIALRASALPEVLAAGSFAVAFAVPRTSAASPGTLASLRAALPLYKQLSPIEWQQARLDQRCQIGGSEWIVVGLIGASTLE